MAQAKHAGVQPVTETPLALRRLLIFVLTTALLVILGAALWHFGTAWLFPDGQLIRCVNPDINCGPG